jgi:uncharacterized protein YrrD
MELQLESPVVSADGVDLGKIHRIIFDPQSAEVKSIVLKKGAFFARDVAIPIEDVHAATAERVELSLSGQEVDSVPDFIEGDYTWPHDTWISPYGWASGGVMWPMAYAGFDGYPGYAGIAAQLPDSAIEQEKQRDAENAIVGQGSEVLAKGGEKVGEVHNLVIDPVSHKPSSVVVRSGFVFTEDVEIPGDWIASYDDYKVTLNVDKPTVEHLGERKTKDAHAVVSEHPVERLDTPELDVDNGLT